MPTKCCKCGAVVDGALFSDGNQTMCFDCYTEAVAGDCTEAAQCVHKPPRTQLGEPCPSAQRIAELEAQVAEIADIKATREDVYTRLDAEVERADRAEHRSTKLRVALAVFKRECKRWAREAHVFRDIVRRECVDETQMLANMREYHSKVRRENRLLRAELAKPVSRYRCPQCHGHGQLSGPISVWCSLCRGTGAVEFDPSIERVVAAAQAWRAQCKEWTAADGKTCDGCYYGRDQADRALRELCQALSEYDKTKE